MKNLETLKKALTDSISEVLETMFFLTFEFDESCDVQKKLEEEGERLINVKLNYKGEITGCVIMFIPNELASDITADFMGKDSVEQDEVEGTAKEIINMVTGNLFSHYNKENIYDLDIPEILSSKVLKEKNSNHPDEISIAIKTVDDYFVIFKLVVEP